MDHNTAKSLIEAILGLEGDNPVILKSLADDINSRSKVATICIKEVLEQFQDTEECSFNIPGYSEALGLSVDENRPTASIVVDHHFIGLTTLSCPKPDEHEVE